MHRQTHPVHFEDFGGNQFERLCFALLVRMNPDVSVEWIGQSGDDAGRDIVVRTAPPLIVQCANVRRLTFKKAEDDLGKLAALQIAPASDFLLVAGGSVGAALREKIEREALRVGFRHAAVWSAGELEERLRMCAPELLRRFIEGAVFPETAAELLAAGNSTTNDPEIIAALSLAFDRPAFRTHFHQESSLPRFKEAIAETIRTLNTGLTPQGGQLPSRHAVRDAKLRARLEQLVGLLVTLRTTFDGFLRDGSIKPCGCSATHCPIFFFEHCAAMEMDRRRAEILSLVHELEPRFQPHFY